MPRKCEVVVVADKDERISRDKGHRGEHGGPDVEVHGAPVRLIILLDGKIAGKRRPKIGAPKQRYVQQTQGEDKGVENHPNERWRDAGVSVDGFGDEIPDMLYVDF
jgi:hypothetical protein